MKRLNISFLVALVASVLLATSVHAEPQSLRIAAIIPLSGEAASWGNAFKNGVTMGLEDLPVRVREQISLDYEDDGLTAKGAVAAFHKLNGEKRVDAVLNLSSVTAQALVPITEAKGITLLAIASDGAVSRGRLHAFNFWVTPDEESRVLIPEMKKRGYLRIARISTLNNGVIAINEAFDRENQGQISIVIDKNLAADNKDFRDILTLIRSKEREIDAVLIALMPGHLSTFARQLRQSGSKLPLVGFETLEDVNENKLARGALTDALYVNADEGQASFLEDYKKRFPGASSYIAANGYDAIRILGKAVENGVRPENLSTYINQLKDYKGALGTFSASGDQRFSLPAVLKVVTKDGFSRF
jgi:branched-chain amino acid transport system substrate-binding protein